MGGTKEKKKGITEREMESVLQGLWLTYYNDTLYAKGVITEADRNKMRVIIKKRTVSQ